MNSDPTQQFFKIANRNPAPHLYKTSKLAVRTEFDPQLRLKNSKSVPEFD